MKRPISILTGGLFFLITAACSLTLFGLPTPYATTPYPGSFTSTVRATVSPSPTSIALTPVVSTQTPVPPSPTSTARLPSPTRTVLLPSPTPTATIPANPTATLTATATTASVTPAAPSGPYGVVLLVSPDVLNIRSGPGPANPVVGSFAANATTVMRTGPSATSGSDLWVQVQNPGGGTGWVNAKYLTEYAPSAAFCADSRVNTLLGNLDHALTTSDGDQLASLVSQAHGMNVRLYRYGTVVSYDPPHARALFESTYQVDWGPAPGSGQETVGSFHVAVLPGLQEVFNASYTLSCDTVRTGGASYDTSWPAQYANINFYSAYKPGPSGNELSWRTVLVGVEYVGGQPYVFSLTQMAWEP